ncbi:MAG: hypothetical protein Q7S12_01955 [bacterium]|nr:hypothetical protein [bacterium]
MRPFSKETFMNIKRKLKKENAPEWKNYAPIVLGIVLAVISIVWMIAQNNIPTSKYVQPKITFSAEGEAVKFPEDIPLNSKTKVVQSYSATYPGFSALQVTTVFASSVSVQESYDFYKNWALANGWQVINSYAGGSIFSLYLRKGTEDINITINKDSETSVSISYVNKSK